MHYTFYSNKALADVYSSSFSRDSDTYTLTVIQGIGNYDYSEAAKCVYNTMKSWDSIQKDIAKTESEHSKQTAKQFLEGTVDWDGLESVSPKITGQDIIALTHPSQIVLIEGIIDNVSEGTFDIWVPHDNSYMRVPEWKHDMDLGDISNGSTVEICIETYEDGSLKKTENILAIRKLDIPIKENIVDEFKVSCKDLDYNNIMRNPDNAKGTIWKATGTVFQIVSTESRTQEFLLKLNDGNMVYVTYFKDENADNILEGDNVNVYGTFYITKTYTTLLGESKTIPKLTSDYVDIN